MDATRRENLVWLAAMLEAEGIFTFQYSGQLKNGKVDSHIQPLVIFINSDLLLVGRVEQVMSDFGCVPHQGKPRTTGMGGKLKTELLYNGFRSLPLLELLRPHMVGEKTECVELHDRVHQVSSASSGDR